MSRRRVRSLGVLPGRAPAQSEPAARPGDQEEEGHAPGEEQPRMTVIVMLSWAFLMCQSPRQTRAARGKGTPQRWPEPATNPDSARRDDGCDGRTACPATTWLCMAILLFEMAVMNPEGSNDLEGHERLLYTLIVSEMLAVCSAFGRASCRTAPAARWDCAAPGTRTGP